MLLHGCSYGEVTIKIWWESVERFKSYSNFSKILKFQNGVAAILDFEIRVFGTAVLLGISRGINLWSLTALWSAVEKLLRFLFPIGNALEVPKIGVFGDFRGQNWNLYLSEPNRAPHSAKTRVLTYYAPKSVHICDVWSVSMIKPEIVHE